MFEQLLRDLAEARARWLKGDADQVVPGWTGSCDEWVKLQAWIGWRVEERDLVPGEEEEGESISPASLGGGTWSLEGRLTCLGAALVVHHRCFLALYVQQTCLLPWRHAHGQLQMQTAAHPLCCLVVDMALRMKEGKMSCW